MARQKDQFTIKDVAKAAGMGVGTVSRVLNDQPHVNSRSRQKVLDAIEKLGYQPDLLARSMRAGRSQTLAFVVRDFTGAALGTLADAVQNEADGLGFSLFVASSYHDPQRELALLQRFRARRVDGIVVATSSETNQAIAAELTTEGLPCVLLDRAAPAELDAVQADHCGGTKLAVGHLVELGHRRIALLTGEPDVSPTRERVRGYRDALAQAGLVADPALLSVGSFSVDFSYRETLRLLRAAPRPTAIIAGGTAMLPGVLRAVRELQLVIPRDISVIGGADNDLAQFVTPPVTVIRWDYDALGRTAGRFLVNRLNNPGHPRQFEMFPTELVVRESCAAPFQPALS